MKKMKESEHTFSIPPEAKTEINTNDTGNQNSGKISEQTESNKVLFWPISGKAPDKD
jgi:hypothetical protein